MGLDRFVARRRRARRLELQDRPAHVVRVPPGPDGRPGEVVRARSRSPYVGRMGPDGTRSDFAVLLTPSATLLAVCFGRVEDKGGPFEHATEAGRRRDLGDGMSCVVDPSWTQLGGWDLVTYVMRFRSGTLLREHRFERDGWLFGAGVLSEERDAQTADRLGREVLESWEWLDGTEESENPPYEEPPRVRAVLSESLPFAPDELWPLLREVEHAARVSPDCVRASLVEGCPRGIGERHALHVRVGAREYRTIYEVVDEVPGERVTFAGQGLAWGQLQVLRVVPAPGGSVVSLDLTVAVQPGEEGERTQRRAEMQLQRCMRLIERAARRRPGTVVPGR